MTPIQTFVFMDFGCTRGNRENLTEVSLLAVPRSQYLQPENIEKPQDKKTLDFRSNGFNLDTFNEINNFINQQQKPVCLVSHNGKEFDFPVLKRELQKLNVSLSDDVLCADSLYAFYDILEHSSDDDVEPHVYKGSAVRGIFYKGYNKPDVTYQLGDIYKREVTYPPVVPHPPENDNLMKFRISRKLAKRFLAWTDQIQREFADVKPEELGKFRSSG